MVNNFLCTLIKSYRIIIDILIRYFMTLFLGCGELMMRRTIITVVIVVLSMTAAYAEEYMTICSFTLSELGASSEHKDHRAIADIIGDYDLIVIQEVQDNGGEQHIKAIVDSMITTASGQFSYFTIPGAGRGFPGNEGYAFLYRDSVQADSYGLISDENFGRKPGWATFRAGDFDFLIAAVHLQWSNLDKRTTEAAALLAWLKEYAEKPETEERDFIIVGNTNRFGNYNKTVIADRQTAFHQLLDDPALGESYRLLFCEHLEPEIDVRIFRESLEEDTITTSAGDITITYVGHGSLYFTFDGKVIHVDPSGQQADYSALPQADVIVVTHEHSDHFDKNAINRISTDTTKLVYTEACKERLDGGTVMKNGDSITFGGISIEAVSAYNIVHKKGDGTPYHSKGDGNGYIFTFGDRRIYVAGDTENTPEMKALKDIHATFLPMNLPYTMTPEMVADAALTFRPSILYPYHYGATDTNELLNIFDSLGFDSAEAYVDAGSTTVTDNNNMVYDQIIISAGTFNEFGGAKAILGDNVGIVDFDNLPVFSGKDTDSIKDMVSSHRPVYARFRTDLGDDDGVASSIDNSTPVGFKLRENYPNPFNQSTTIGYSLGGDTHVKLVVYSVTGQVVSIIRDGYAAAGDYSVAWDAKDLPSGIYFCTLKAGKNTQTRKMLLIK